MLKSSTSYGQILKSSSIIGGAQAVNYVIGMARMKLVALLLGPSGVGLVGLYTAATGLVGSIAELGIGTSGVREVAEANGSGDSERLARTLKTLRRVCWATGFLGWVLTAALSYPLSVWTFGSSDRAWIIAVLGVTLLFNSLSGGQTALLQGMRRIGDVARIGVFGAIASTIIAVGLYGWLKQSGIIPVLITTAAANLGFSWWLARRVPTTPVALTWLQTIRNAKQLINLGLAFMYGGVLVSLLGLAVRATILRKLGLDANGIYQAASGISSMFAAFVLSAMYTDFYPRLTAVAEDDNKVNCLVNEQVEVGILLALPGLLGTLAFAPWLMHLFYSAKFLAGAELLPGLVVGSFVQVVIYPLAYIPRAKGEARWMYLSLTHINALQLALVLVLIRSFGLIGTAWAFAIATCIHAFVVFGIARRLSQFSWSALSMRVALSAAGIIFVGFAAHALTDGPLQLALGALTTSAGCLFSLRGISSRLGVGHRIVRMALKLPGGRLACGL